MFGVRQDDLHSRNRVPVTAEAPPDSTSPVNSAPTHANRTDRRVQEG